MLLFSGKRIKTPERGLLSMHPFVDVLEGRSLFTATAHDGVLAVESVVDVPAGERGRSPWSTEPIAPAAAAEPTVLGLPAPTLTAGHVELLPTTTDLAPFRTTGVIGDSAETLFGNALWDRRGKFEPVPLPTDEQLAAARADRDAGDVEGSPFSNGRSLTGAMNPVLTMKAPQVATLFAA